MGSDRTFVFAPEGATGGGGMNGLLAMIPGLLQGKGLDPNLVTALMANRNNQEGFGGGGWWIWVILLFLIFGWGGNGFGGNRNGGGIPAELNNDAGRELLMNAIQGNGTAISQLASSLNCSVQQLQAAICQIQGGIDKVSGQIGMSTQQVINSVQQMSCQIGNQISQCCCDVRTDIQKQGYENQLATLNQTNVLQQSATGQFNVLSAKIDAQTQIINDKFCQLEMREMQNKIDTLRADKAALELAATQQAQTANIVSQLKQPCPIPAYPVPNPNCCYGNPYAFNGYGNDGCGCGN